MNTKVWFSLKPRKKLLIALLLMALCVGVNFTADLLRGTFLFYLLYQGVLVLGICIGVPVWLTVVRQKQPLSTIGITGDKWAKAVLVGAVLAAVSVAGRLMGMHPVIPHVDVLVFVCAGMLMSTLFEEAFFRGYLQTRFEQSFGIIPAVILSGACFSLYHLGYSNIRGNMTELLTLFGIGIFFSISFRITGSIVTSYIVNLPHAILTFIGDPIYGSYLSRFTPVSAVISLVTAAVALGIIVIVNGRNRKGSPVLLEV